MSLINQMLRDLDSREAGTRETPSMPPPVARRESGGAGTARKGIALVLVALSLFTVFWFSDPGQSFRAQLTGLLAEPVSAPVAEPVPAVEAVSHTREAAEVSPAAVPQAAPERPAPTLTRAEEGAAAPVPASVSETSVVRTQAQTALLSGASDLSPAVQDDAADLASTDSVTAVQREVTGKESGTVAVSNTEPPNRTVAAVPVAASKRPAVEPSTAQPERSGRVVESKKAVPARQAQQAERNTDGQSSPAPQAVAGLPQQETETAEAPRVRVTRVSPQVMRQSAGGAYREAREQLEAGDREEAEHALRHALSLDPALHPARHLLSMLRWQQGDRREAEKLLRDGLKMTPLHVPFAVLMARMMIESGEIEGARLLLEQHRSRSADDPDLLSLLGSVYQQGGQFAEAAALYRQLLAERPTDARTLAGLAIALDASGEHREALVRYRAALAAGPLPATVSGYARQRVAALTSEQ